MKNKEIGMKIGLSGEYQIHAHKLDADGNIISSRLVADWFDNNITDFGLNLLGNPKRSSDGSPGYVMCGCAVGTGNAAESNSDTTLSAPKAATETIQVQWASSAQLSVAPYYINSTVTYRFGTGAAAGNLAEIGMLGGATSASAGGTLFSRALIKDSGGSPITITILSDEVLDVTYQLRTYPSSSSGTFNQTINGVVTSFAYSASPCGMSRTGGGKGSANWAMTLPNNSSGFLAAAYQDNSFIEGGLSKDGPASASNVSSNGSAWDSVSTGAYVDDNFYRDCNFYMDLNSANYTSKTWVISFDPLGMFQMALTPNMVKTSAMTYTFVCRVAWGRYVP